MLYLIQHDKDPQLFFNSGSSRWVESSGYCQTPAWGPKRNAWATTSLDYAKDVARINGGILVDENEVKVEAE